MANMEGKRRLLWVALLAAAGVAAAADSPGQAPHSTQAPPAFSTAASAGSGGVVQAAVPPVVLLDDGASMITIPAPGLSSAVARLADLSAALYPAAGGNVPAMAGAGEWDAASVYTPVGAAGMASPLPPGGRFAPSWAMCLFGLVLLAVGWRVRSSGPAVPAAT